MSTTMQDMSNGLVRDGDSGSNDSDDLNSGLNLRGVDVGTCIFSVFSAN